jgi:hypothetical protein
MLLRKKKDKRHHVINPEEMGSELKGVTKSNPFKVPDNYFEKLPVEILQKIKPAKEIPESISIFSNRKFAFAAVITGLLIIFGVIYFNKLGELTDKSQFTYSITLDDLLNESPEIIESIDENTLFETLFAGSDQAFNYSAEDEIEIDSTISRDDLIRFLSEEEISNELLYELLNI